MIFPGLRNEKSGSLNHGLRCSHLDSVKPQTRLQPYKPQNYLLTPRNSRHFCDVRLARGAWEPSG